MPDFFSCDWGTSAFRLRRVARGKIVAEIRDQHGAKNIFEKAGGGPCEKLFSDYLSAKLGELKSGGEGLPLVISGMASSSIGWKELPYAATPLSLQGDALRVETLHWDKPVWLGETLLVSGLATNRDIMRGEETQILGIMSTRPEQNCVLVLPGTHSKHVQIRDRTVMDFRTFMTGELFEVLSRNSILRATTDQNARVQPDAAFREGVAAAQRDGLAGSLFSVRARGVLSKISGAENSSFLSGLLIGAELHGIGGPVLLAATGQLAEFYPEAMKTLGRSDFTSLSPDEVESAVVRGQAMILK